MAEAVYPGTVNTGDTGHAALHNAVDADVAAHKTLLHPQSIADLVPALTTASAGDFVVAAGSGAVSLSKGFTGGNVTSDIVHAAGTSDVYTDRTTGQQARLVLDNGVFRAEVVGTGGTGTGTGGIVDTAGIVALLLADDNESGTGDTFPVMTGPWQVISNVNDRGGSDHYIDAVGSFTYTWTSGILGGLGSTITFRGARAPHHGIAGVSIDGGAEVPVDCYAATRSDALALYTSGLVAAGTHTARWRWTGTKNTASTGTTINHDGVDFTNVFPRPGGSGGGGGGGVTPSSFVKRSGTSLISGSDASWQFVMFNMPTSCGTGGFADAGHTFDTTCGLSTEVYTEAELITLFSTFRQDGKIVIRTWAFGNYTLSNIDKVMAAAKAAKVKVILTLADSYGACGDNSGCTGDGNSFFNGGWKNNYATNINRLTAAYKNNPELLAWEVCNEPPNATNVVAAYGEITALIRSLDPNHLISSGTQPGWLYGGDTGQKWKDINATCDIASMHEYDNGAQSCSSVDGPVYQAPSNHYAASLASAKAIGRPLMVGEFGLNQGCGGNDNGATRAARVTDKLNSYMGTGGSDKVAYGDADAAVCGVGVWALTRTNTGGHSFAGGSPEFNALNGFTIAL